MDLHQYKSVEVPGVWVVGRHWDNWTYSAEDEKWWEWTATFNSFEEVIEASLSAMAYGGNTGNNGHKF